MKTSIALKKGFTLTEMLIVILIIALLMAFIIPQLLKGPTAARDATRINRVNQIAVALEAYRSSNGAYPTGNFCIATDNPSKFSGFISEEALKDPMTGNVFEDCGSPTGGYMYKSFPLNGIADQAFAVVTKLEADGKGNISALTTNNIDSNNITPNAGKLYAKFSY